MHSALLLVITVLAGSVAASSGTLNSKLLAVPSSEVRTRPLGKEVPGNKLRKTWEGTPHAAPRKAPYSDLRKTQMGAPNDVPSDSLSDTSSLAFSNASSDMSSDTSSDASSNTPSDALSDTLSFTSSPASNPASSPASSKKGMIEPNSMLRGRPTRIVEKPSSNEPDKELLTQLSSELIKTRRGAPNDSLYQEKVRNLDPKHLNRLTFVEIADLMRAHWSAKIDWTQVSIKDIFANSAKFSPLSEIDPEHVRAAVAVLLAAGFDPHHGGKPFDMNDIELAPTHMLTLTRLLTDRCLLMKYVTINPLKLVFAIWGNTGLSRDLEDDAIENLFKCLQYDSQKNPLVIDDSNASDDAALARLIKMLGTAYKLEVPIKLHPSVLLRAIAIIDERHQNEVPYLLLKGASIEKPSVVSVLLQPAATVAKGLAKYVTDPTSYGCFVGKAADDLKAFLESPDSQSMKHEHRQTQLDWLAKCKTLSG